MQGKAMKNANLNYVVCGGTSGTITNCPSNYYCYYDGNTYGCCPNQGLVLTQLKLFYVSIYLKACTFWTLQLSHVLWAMTKAENADQRFVYFWFCEGVQQSCQPCWRFLSKVRWPLQSIHSVFTFVLKIKNLIALIMAWWSIHGNRLQNTE